MGDRFETLERLAKLRDLNVLTPDEFAAEKARILATQNGKPNSEGTRSAHRTQAALRGRKWLPWIIGAGLTGILGVALGYATLSESNDAGDADEGQEQSQTLPSGPGSATVNLENLLVFEDEKTCAPGTAFQSFLDDLSARTHSDLEINLPVPGASVKAQIQAPDPSDGAFGATLVSAPVSGAWQGLKVTGIRTASWQGSEVRTFQIRFAEPLTKVRRVLNNTGFDLGTDGEMKESVVAQKTRAYGLESIYGGTALTCGTAE